VLLVACAPAAQPAAPSVAGGASGTAPSPPVDLAFRLNWTKYGEHAFFFVALEKGFYREQGLNVTINEGSGSATVAKLIGAGTDPIGYVDTPTMMQAVAAGVPIKSVLVIQQKNPSSVIYRLDNPIRTAKDLEGKKIAHTAGDSFGALFPALVAANNLDMSKIQLVSLPTAAAKETALLQGQVDGMMGFYNDQPLRMMKNTGVKLSWLKFFDWGVNVLSTGVVVNEEFLKTKPEIVRKFLAGTVKGIEYTKANPDEAAQIFAKYAGEQGFDKELSRQEIDETIPLLQTPTTQGWPTGCMSAKDWQASYELLVKYTGLKTGMDPLSFFTNDYLPYKCPSN
jgi:NitT/TauT family transport system substrate-binding protein